MRRRGVTVVVLAALTLVSCSTSIPGRPVGDGPAPSTTGGATRSTAVLTVDECPGEVIGRVPLALEEASSSDTDPERTGFTDVAISPAGIVYASTEQAMYCIDGDTVHEVFTLRSADLPDAPGESVIIGAAVDTDGGPLAVEFRNPRVLRPTDAGVEIVPGSDDPEIGGSRSMTVGPDGTIYMTGLDNSGTTFVWAIRDGGATPFAGPGEYATARDDGPATDTYLYEPEGLAAAPDGSLVIADRNNQRVVRVGPDGLAETLAGGRGFDDRPDSDTLEVPNDVAVDADGNVLVLDLFTGRDHPGAIQRIVGPDELEPVLEAGAACDLRIEGATSPPCPGGEYDFDGLYAFDVAADGSLWLIHLDSLLRYRDGTFEVILTLAA